MSKVQVVALSKTRDLLRHRLQDEHAAPEFVDTLGLRLEERLGDSAVGESLPDLLVSFSHVLEAVGYVTVVILLASHPLGWVTFVLAVAGGGAVGAGVAAAKDMVKSKQVSGRVLRTLKPLFWRKGKVEAGRKQLKEKAVAAVNDAVRQSRDKVSSWARGVMKKVVDDLSLVEFVGRSVDRGVVRPSGTLE